jgi:hypothetical protein
MPDRVIEPHRDTTQSPEQTWDAPVYEQFYRTAREVNRPLPTGRQIRVLLGDPPIDWSQITKAGDVADLRGRDAYPVSVVEQRVLAKRCRAQLCYGGGHLLHAGPEQRRNSLASIIE